MAKPVVAVDIDEVLAQFIPKLAEFHNEKYGGATLTTESFVSYDFHKVWGGSALECNAKVEAFLDSNHFKDQLEPVPMALEALIRMKELYSLHVVTARQHAVADITRSWLDKHYPNIFEDIHFGNHYSTSGKSRSKAEMCKAIGAKLLIDDNMVYATQCALEGISVVLFGQYPWNQAVGKDVAHHFHDMTVVVNAHMKNEVVIQDFHEDLFLEDRAAEKMSIGPHHVYRVASWVEVEKAVEFMLSNRADMSVVRSRASSQSPGRQLGVAVIQMNSKGDKAVNLERTRALIEQALADPLVSLVCLPENSAFLGESAAQSAAASEVLTGEYVQQLCAIAREKKVWLSVGGFAERTDELTDVVDAAGQALPKTRNAHLLINRDGYVTTPVYRKIHLFDCPLVGLQESAFTLPGNQVVVTEIEGWRVGLSVCYDLRFPALFQAMEGVDLLLVPAAFTVPTGVAHWEVLLRARAVENQCYVAAAAQSGRHSERRTSYGHSMVVDPWGKIAGQLFTEDEGVFSVLLEKTRIEGIRKGMPLCDHKRPGVYSNQA